MNLHIARVLFSTFMLALLTTQASHAASQDNVVFDIAKFEVIGNTLLPPSMIDSTLAPFIGKDRDFDTIQSAMDALEKLFHDKGYKLTSIGLMEQELNRGVVQLNVVSTTIGRIIVSGNSFFDNANIARSLPGLVVGKTPNMDALSHSIKFANEHPNKKITTKLRTGENPNEVDAILDVQEENPWKMNASADNAGQVTTGSTNIGFALQNNNFLGRDHLLNVQYATTAQKPKQIGIYGGSYHIPLYETKNSLDFYANYSDVDSGTVVFGLTDIGITGKGTIVGTRYNMRLSDDKNSEAKLALGLDVKAFKNTQRISGFDLGSEIVVRPVSLNYLNQWVVADGLMNISLTVLQNIPGANNGNQDDFEKSRQGAKANFGLLRYSMTYFRASESDLQIRTVLNGQYARSALISGEQFGAGGASSVRGFSERALSDDSGMSLNAELYSSNLCLGMADWNCRFLGFYDAAFVKRNEPLPGELGRQAISSGGLGWRFSMGTRIALQIDYGHVLKENKFGSAARNRTHARANFSF